MPIRYLFEYYVDVILCALSNFWLLFAQIRVPHDTELLTAQHIIVIVIYPISTYTIIVFIIIIIIRMYERYCVLIILFFFR
jgi:hypothetical protein